MTGPRGTVLVVDDSETVRSVLCSILQGDTFKVVEAADGLEGLDRLRNDPSIGLVFLDLHMPRMDGLGMLDAMAAEASLKAPPVVVLTGSGPDPSVVTAKDLGAVGWLQKPVRLEAVLKVARRYLGER